MNRRKNHEFSFHKSLDIHYKLNKDLNIINKNEDYNINNLNKNISKLIEQYDKKQYRKTIEEIEIIKNNYNINDIHNSLLTHIQIKCVLKIIEKKYRDYKEKAYLKGVDKWLKIFEKFLEHFSNGIEYLNFNKKEQYEYLNYYHLTKLYLYAVLEKQKNNNLECLSYLLLAEKIIDETLNEIKFPQIYRIIQKIYLFKISFLISDKNFLTALNYIVVLFELCNKHLYFFLSLNQENQKNNYEKIIKDTLFTITICFYYLGCISENLKDCKIAYFCYNQTYFFVKNYLQEKYPYLFLFFEDLLSRVKIYLKIFSSIDKLNNIFLINSRKKNKKKEYVSKLFINEKEKRLKYIESYLNKLKIKEIDDDNEDLFNEIGTKRKSKKTINLMKNVFLLNYLTNKEFKPVIKKLDNLNINKFDHNFKKIIQNKISSIKSNKRYHYIDDLTDKNILTSPKSKSKYFKQIKNISHSNNLSNSNVYHSLENNSQKKTKKENRKIISYSFIITNKPLKINYDKYIFDKDYIKKRQILDSQSEKEYQFQKLLLREKKSEKIFISPFNIQNSKKKAENLFNLTMDDKLQLISEKNRTIKTGEKKNYFNSIIFKTSNALLEKSCKSLSSKDREKYYEFIKKTKRRNSIIKSRMLYNNRNSFFNCSEDNEDLNEKNKEVMNLLEYNINNLEKKEEKLRKNKSQKVIHNKTTLYKKVKKPVLEIYEEIN